jgi:NAD(P)H-hydrate epimerase
MRALDRHSIETLGVPGELLMESAGRAVAETVLRERPPGGSVLVVCGSGNNGGDGLVAARQLALLGVPVRIALLGEPAKLRGDAAANLARVRALELPVGGADFRAAGADVIVDALFGTGLVRELRGPAAAAVRRLNAARPRARILAVDLPSGLDADTGQPLGVAVQADVTVTLALPKLGLVLEPGRSLAGRVLVARIGIATRAPQVEPDARLWTLPAAGRRLPARPRSGHKGGFGHVLVLAGSQGKTGAAALAAEGAGRGGAGLVTVGCPAGVNDILEVKCTEAMTEPLPDGAGRAFCEDAVVPSLALVAERDAVALGPGVGRAAPTQAFVRRLAERLRKPVVIDADGLFAFVGDPVALKARSAATVLTPHPGEAARLLGVSSQEVNRDRLGAARRLADLTACTVLLKGAATVAADPDGRAVVNPTGGPVLGSGGTGDVLTGLVAAFLAQRLEPLEAAALAAYVHGHAADRIAARSGSSGALAGELARELPEATQALRQAAWATPDEEESPGAGLVLPFP